MKKNIILMFISVSFFLCTLMQTPFAQAQTVTDLTAEQFISLQANPPAGFLILDVRTPEEFHAGRINGAVSVDLHQDFKAKVNEFPRDAPVLVYCRTGNRSNQAVKILQTMGFTRIFHFTGGMQAWEKAGLPVLR